MRLLYYKPVLNPAGITPGYEAGQHSVYMAFAELMDGERTADEIIGTLLRNGHPIGEIIEVFNDLHRRNIIFEAPENDPELFTEEETQVFEKQMNAFARLGFEKGGIFLPYSKSAVKQQHRLKKAQVMVIGDGLAAFALIESLVAVGIGTVYFYPLKSLGRDEEQKIAQRFKMNMYDFSEVHIHRSFTGDIDETFLRTCHADVVIYIPGAFSDSQAVAVNRVCHENGKDFVPYRFSFPYVHIGPFHLSNCSACLCCCEETVEPHEELLSGFNLPAGIDMLCVEIVKYYSRLADISVKDGIWTFDMLTGKSRLEAVFRKPGCALCGDGRTK